MEPMILYITTGVLAVLLSAALIWFRQKGYIDFIKNFYLKYQVIIDAYGEFIRRYDQKLYDELIECGEVFRKAVSDDEITRDELLGIYKEAKDVYDRCKELIDKGGL